MFDYDADTGALIRKITPGMRGNTALRFGGKPAGTVDARGYILVHVGSIRARAHRIVWKMTYGVEPGDIDHINGNPNDNRIENLREATPGENARNRPGNRGRSLPKGVYADHGGFRAQIVSDGRAIYLGAFRTISEAQAAYAAAALRHHGSFARTTP